MRGQVAERGTRVKTERAPLTKYPQRVADGLNVNLRLVAVGAAAPFFYDHERGRYAARLEALTASARNANLGLWKTCPRTPYDPFRGVETG